MKIVVLESLGISDEELSIISKPLTDSRHELVVNRPDIVGDSTF